MNKSENTSINLNIKAYGGYIRYMLTKKGSFNDLDLFVDNNFDKDISPLSGLTNLRNIKLPNYYKKINLKLPNVKIKYIIEY